MLFIERIDTDPHFNLAAEEYIFHNYDDEVIMLWRNSPVVIIGKHQNPYAEVNIPHIKEKKIPVIRRISGGGTVYHDLGNLNFTFIRRSRNDDLINYRTFLQPVISILNRWAIPCKLGGKSDLVVNNQKISGNSKHVFKNKVLHHGTLLFSSNIDHLNKALENRHERFRDKSVRSNPGQVANISEFLAGSVTIGEFYDRLARELLIYFSPVKVTCLTQNDKDQISQLAAKKYKSWEWNFGYSPPYTFSTDILIHDQPIQLEISVVKGLIREIRTFGIGYASKLNASLEMLIGLQHEESAIRQSFEKAQDKLIITLEEQEYLLKQLF